MAQKARPIEIIPFKINNLGEFLGDSQYPRLHPLSVEYDKYWTKRSEECIYGLWGDDSRKKMNGEKIGGYRWLPGNMVFHTQHCIIQKEIKGQRSKGPGRPDTRDVEFFVGYDLATCDGFAGYEYDKKRTAFRPVQKIELGEKLTNADKLRLDEFGDILHDKWGKWKKYVDAREMLYQTYDEPMGNPLWLNESQNYMLLSTRRLGKSYIIINGVAVYNFVFNGARTLEEFLEQKSTSTTIVGSGVSDKTKEFFTKFHTTYDHLRLNVGSYFDGDTEESGAFWWKYGGSVSKENDFLTNRVKVEGQDGYTGPGSTLWNVTYGKSLSKGAGFSLNDAIIEEVGLTPNAPGIHAENSPAQRGDYKFGKSIYIGTGGDFDIIEGNKSMFYNPRAFEILPCKNQFVPGAKDIARFIPATYYLNKFRDENGNLEVQPAFEDIMTERDRLEKEDTQQYLRNKASFPLFPDEIFLKYDGNSFPVKNLEEQLFRLKNGEVPYSTGRIAFHDSQNKSAYWMEDLNLTPLMEMEDLNEENLKIGGKELMEGCFVQYEPPSKDRPARKYDDRNPMYLTFAEPVRNDKGTSWVYSYVWKFDDFRNPDKMQHNMVMEWFGRIDNDNTANLKRIFAMAALYDSNIYSEVNNDEIVREARRQKKYDWLIPNLGYVEGMESAAGQQKNEVGLYVHPGMGPGLEKLTNEFLRREVTFTEKIVGKEFIRESVIVADTLNTRMGCSQLIAYNRDGNFDAYDGLRLLAFWDKVNQAVEDQYANPEEGKRIREVIEHLKKQRVFSRRLGSRNRNR